MLSGVLKTHCIRRAWSWVNLYPTVVPAGSMHCFCPMCMLASVMEYKATVRHTKMLFAMLLVEPYLSLDFPTGFVM